MKNILPVKLLPAVFIILLLVPSCKKDTVVKTAAVSRSFDFKASAATPMNISIAITRPSGNMYINIDVIGLSNINGSYEYTPSNVQVGDKVVITIKTAQNQPITGSLTINSIDVPHTNLTLSDPEGLSSVSWDTVVN